MRYIIWGAGYCGNLALNYLKTENVICYVDTNKSGTNYLGKSVISLDEMKRICATELDVCVCIASDEYHLEMEKQLISWHVQYFVFIPSDIYSDMYGNDYSILNQFKDIHKGKRIFLIGNGPSLSVEDLNTLYLHSEKCFGFNKVYSIYNRTNWRADYYGFTDYMSYKINKQALADYSSICFIWDYFGTIDDIDLNNVFLFKFLRERFYPEEPKFSYDITKGTYLGNTVLYDIGFQFAVYMGVSEIILLGVDHDYNGNIADRGNHFEGYFSDNDAKECFTPFQIEKVEKAYKKAQNVCTLNNIKVFNASRNSRLEMFDRVNFDDLF